jgi:putative proteasome-type protease
MDSTMKSNVTVGPPVELLLYQRDSLVLDRYRRLDEDDPYLRALRNSWAENIRHAIATLPSFRLDILASPPDTP